MEGSLPRVRGIGSWAAGVAAGHGRAGRGGIAAGTAVPAREAAFAFLDDERLTRTYRTAALILRDTAEAEDATHEAIERAWVSWPTLRDEARLEAWFDRIVVNVCRNRLRHRRKLVMLPLDDDLSGSPRDEQASTLERISLEPAFERLTPDHRIVIVLRFWRDLTVDEIAVRLGVPAGTVKSRLHYALLALRDAMESEGRTR